MTKNLLVGLILVVCFQATLSNGQTTTSNPVVGTWKWSFSDKPSKDEKDLVSHDTVTLRADGTMEWDGHGDKGIWEGPKAIEVLLRWDKGDIDMLELKDDGKTLQGINAKKWKVKGTRQGAGDTTNVYGIWNWAFAESGEPKPCGTVKFKSDDTMEWKPPFTLLRGCGVGLWDRNRVDPGRYQGPTEQGVLLRWDKGDIDMLQLNADGRTLEGKNKKEMLVRGTKK